MLPALWVSKTGLSAQDMNLTTISNNLANVSTTGFKRDRAEFEDLLYQIRRQPGGPAASHRGGRAGGARAVREVARDPQGARRYLGRGRLPARHC